MWRKATYYRSTSFAALVVGSSIALLTGAQAATLDFGPGSPSGLASRGGQQAIIVSLPNASAPSPQITTGPASFGALSGTFAFGTAASSFAPQPTLRYTQAWNPAGGGNFNVGSTVFPIFTASFDGGADTLRGNVNLFLGQASLVGGSADQAILNGTFTLTNAVGSPDFLSSLPAINSTTPFSWTLNGDGVTSLAALQMMPIGTPTTVTLMPAAGFITTPGAPTGPEVPEIPLPPAIYLFGSVLGGAFWMSRRKRSAVSTLGA